MSFIGFYVAKPWKFRKCILSIHSIRRAKGMESCVKSFVVDTALILRLLLAGGLVAANAFFVVAEFSLVRVRPTRLRELAKAGHGGASGALRLVGRMDALLSAVQLGVTMASLGLGWAGESTVADILEPLLGGVAGHIVALGIAFLGISGMHIVFGELVPKSL